MFLSYKIPTVFNEVVFETIIKYGNLTTRLELNDYVNSVCLKRYSQDDLTCRSIDQMLFTYDK